MGQKKWYLIAYDIRDPARLRKVSKHLKGYGERIQFSIFRCRLSEREVERLRWELQKILANNDDLLVVGLCGSCVNRLNNKSDYKFPEELANYEII